MSRRILNENQQKQINRFKDVTEYLSSIGIRAQQIIDKKNEKFKKYVIGDTNSDSEYELLEKIDVSKISEYKRGQDIPKEFLDFLQENYYINPDYIRGKSDWMLDIFAERIDNFKSRNAIIPSFVISENIDNTERKFLALKMDSNLYDYILAISPEKLTSQNNIVLSSSEREKVEKIYEKSKEPEYKEYILMPYDRITRRYYMEHPVNLERELLLLKLDFKNLEDKVSKLTSNVTSEELSSIISEIHEKIQKISSLSDYYNKNKK